MGVLIGLLILAGLLVLLPVALCVTLWLLLPAGVRKVFGGHRGGDKGERRPHLRAYLMGLWVEHSSPELAVFVVLWAGWWWAFVAFGSSPSAAALSAVLVGVAAGWWHSRPAPQARRRARRFEAQWAKACVALGLYSFSKYTGRTLVPDLTRIEHTHGNTAADFTLPPNVGIEQLQAAEVALQRSFGGGHHRSFHVIPEDNRRAGRIYIKRTVAFDRHSTEPFPYVPGKGIAVKEDGTPMRFEFGADGPMMLVAGIKGAGKSSVINAVVAESLAVPFKVNRWGMDPKEVELHPWADVFDRLALKPAEMTELLQDALTEYERRKQLMKDKGIRKVAPGCGIDPWLLVVDELKQVVDDQLGEPKGAGNDRYKMLSRVLAVGRAVSMQVVVATQNPRAAYVGEVRENCDITVCCRVRTRNEAYTAMGDLGYELRPDMITKAEQGVGWVMGDDRPYKMRAVWLDDGDVRRIAKGKS
jgi:hypothetical protein